jgi:hypothetical protein
MSKSHFKHLWREIMAQDTYLNTAEPRKACFPQKSITWQAVITGALIAVGLTFLFNLLTVGLGLSIYSTTNEGVNTLAFAGFIATLIGAIVILFIAGWKTGKLIKMCPKHCHTCGLINESSVNPAVTTEKGICTFKHHCCYNSMTHGFLTWVFYLMISLVFLSFVSHAQTLNILKNSFFISIPAEHTENITTGAAVNNPTTYNALSQVEARRDKPAAVAAKVVGAETIAIFLISLFGAASCALGSYFGLMAKIRCYQKYKM